jgi:hypothetical protein
MKKITRDVRVGERVRYKGARLGNGNGEEVAENIAVLNRMEIVYAKWGNEESKSRLRVEERKEAEDQTGD